jgi:hypothetical protein
MAWMHGRGAIVRGAVAIVALVVGVLLLVVQPWGSEDKSGSSAPDFGGAELSIQGKSHTDVRRVGGNELMEAFPLPIQLPAYVPDGYHLANVRFFEPPAGLDRLSGANHLMAVYQKGDAAIRLSQSPGFDVRMDAATEQLPIRGVEADYAAVDRAEGAQILTWARCRRIFELQRSPEDALSKGELVRITESIGPEQCEPGVEATP